MTVIALAGRRIDDPFSEPPRFPAANIRTVREHLHAAFVAWGATTLVASAANGADLLAHDVAWELGLRRRIVLPFDRERFRRTSVADRPGHWGGLFDRILDETAERGDIITIASVTDDLAAYLAASDAILREAVRLAGERQELAAAIVVWEGRSRGEDDQTYRFCADAKASSLAVLEISTLS